MLMEMTITAQDKTLQPFDMDIAPLGTQYEICGLSGSSAFLLFDITQNNLSLKDLTERYHLITQNGEPSVAAFITMADNATADALADYGVVVKHQAGNILAVQIPLNRYAALCASGFCSMIKIGEEAHPALDIARATTGVNNMYNGTGYSQRYDGTGVVVGIVDIGLEYAHAAFYDSTGTTLRVKRVWDQNATSGTAPSAYSYGAEYATPSAIIAAQTDDPTETHGTHVAGIAAGCGGSNATAKTYRGIAPAADIVLVSTTMTTASIMDGITYIIDYAESVGKPCVINLSLGSHIGPHDGTSAFDRFSDNLLNQTQGIVLVGAVGNEGDDALHLTKTFDGAGDSMLYSFIDFDGDDYGITSIDIWGEPGKSYMAGLIVVDTVTGAISSSSNYYLSNVNTSDNTSIASGLVSFYVWQGGSDAYNNRQNIYFHIDVSSQLTTNSNNRVALVVKSTEAQTLHAWNNNGIFEDCGFSSVTAGDFDYTVNETGGSGNSMLTVGSYATRSNWSSTNGHNYSVSQTVGALSYFSSHGPTLDGRVKPDVIAPGQYIAAPINRFYSSYCTGSHAVANTTIGGITEYYAVMQGTSMATPFMTGVVALWLQDNPTLTYGQVIAIAHATALQDSYTGNIPATGSNLYGWGKVNPAGAIDSEAQQLETYTITAQSADTTMGSANVNGNGVFYGGSQAILTATANRGYRFVYWQDNNTQNPRTITVTADATYTAYFEDVCSNISTFPYSESFENAFECWTPVDANNDGNTWDDLASISTALPHEGTLMAASFSWRQDVPYNADDYLISPRFILPADHNITLSWWFKVNGSYPEDKYKVLVSTTGNAISDFGTTLIDITPTAENNNWTEQSLDLTAYAGQAIYLAFHHYDTYDMNYLLIDDITITTETIQPPETYIVTVQSADPSMGRTEGGGTFNSGDNTTIRAIAHDGYRFVRWQDNNTQNPRTITVTADATYTAFFESTTGIADLEADGITIYVHDKHLNVKCPTDESIVLNDMMGRTLSTAYATLDIQLPAGVYFVHIGNRHAVKVIMM